MCQINDILADMEPKAPGMEKTPGILSIEEFVQRSHNDRGHPTYNNFPIFFKKEAGLVGMFYKNNPLLIRFAQENPEIYAELCEKVELAFNSKEFTNDSDKLKPIHNDLYEAYKIMREYGATDHELFA
jgi:hypothetical protein